jgi:O-antigen ligase
VPQGKSEKGRDGILSVALALVLFLAGLGLSSTQSDFRFWYRHSWEVVGLEWSFILFYFMVTHRPAELWKEILLHHRKAATLGGLWVAVVLASYLSSPYYGYDNPLALMRLAETFSHPLFFVVLWDFFSHYRPRYLWICMGVLLPALGVTVLFFLGILFDKPGGGIWNIPMLHWGELHVNDNVRRIGYQLETAIVMASCLFPKKNLRIQLLLFIVPVSAFLFWLGGRASILGALIGIAFYFAMRGKGEGLLKLAAWMAVALLLGWIAVHFQTGVLQISHDMAARTLHAADLDQASSGRLSLWSSILYEWKGHPWLGTGPQSCFFYPQRGEMIVHPHNFLLQFLVEWGLLGVMLFALLLTALLRRGWEYYREKGIPDRPIRLTALSLILALSLSGLFGGTYFFAHTSLTLALAYALWVSVPHR